MYLAEAREIYKNSQDARLAYQKIGRTDKIEAKLLWGLNICGQKNLQGALDLVPRNTMLMYIHAYQSIIWNKIVSRRIKEFGLKPIIGDLVYENPDCKDDGDTIHDDVHHTDEEEGKSSGKAADDAKDQKTNESDAKKEDSEKPTEANAETQEKSNLEKKENVKTEEDKNSDKGDNEKPLPKVKVLTEEDLPNYTMADIIMPQPGWKVTYPPYAQAWFDEQLEKDSLTKDLKQKNK